MVSYNLNENEIEIEIKNYCRNCIFRTFIVLVDLRFIVVKNYSISAFNV